MLFGEASWTLDAGSFSLLAHYRFEQTSRGSALWFIQPSAPCVEDRHSPPGTRCFLEYPGEEEEFSSDEDDREDCCSVDRPIWIKGLFSFRNVAHENSDFSFLIHPSICRGNEMENEEDFTDSDTPSQLADMLQSALAKKYNLSGSVGGGDGRRALVPEKKKLALTYEESVSREQEKDMLTMLEARKKKKKGRKEEERSRDKHHSNHSGESIQRAKIGHLASNSNAGNSCGEFGGSQWIVSPKKKKKTLHVKDLSEKETGIFASPEGSKKKKKRLDREFEKVNVHRGTYPSAVDLMSSSFEIDDDWDDVDTSQAVLSPKKEPVAHFKDGPDEDEGIFRSPERGKKRKRRRDREFEKSTEDHESEEGAQPSSVDLRLLSSEAGNSCGEIGDSQWIVSPKKKKKRMKKPSHAEDDPEEETGIFTSPGRRKKKKRKKREFEKESEDCAAQPSAVDLMSSSFEIDDDWDDVDTSQAVLSPKKEPVAPFKDGPDKDEGIFRSPERRKKKKKGRKEDREFEKVTEDHESEEGAQPSSIDLRLSSPEAVNSCGEIGDSQWIVSPKKKKRVKKPSHAEDDPEKETGIFTSPGRRKKKKRMKRELEKESEDCAAQPSAVDLMLSSFEIDDSWYNFDTIQAVLSPKKEPVAPFKDSPDKDEGIFRSPERRKKKKKGRKEDREFEKVTEDHDSEEGDQPSSVDLVLPSPEADDAWDVVDTSQTVLSPRKKKKGLVALIEDGPDKDEGIFRSPERRKKKKKGRKEDREFEKSTEDHESEEGAQPSSVDLRLSSPEADDSWYNFDTIQAVLSPKKEKGLVALIEDGPDKDEGIFRSPERSKKKKRERERELEKATEDHESEEGAQPSSVDLVLSSPEAVNSCGGIGDSQWIVSPKKKRRKPSHAEDDPEEETGIFTSPGRRKKKKRKKRELEKESEDCAAQPSAVDLMSSSFEIDDDWDDVDTIQAVLSPKKEPVAPFKDGPDKDEGIFRSPERRKKKKKGRKDDREFEKVTEDHDSEEGDQPSSVDLVLPSPEADDAWDVVDTSQTVLSPRKKKKGLVALIEDGPDKDEGIIRSPERSKKKERGRKRELEKSTEDNESEEGAQPSSVDLVLPSSEAESEPSGSVCGDRLLSSGRTGSEMDDCVGEKLVLPERPVDGDKIVERSSSANSEDNFNGVDKVPGESVSPDEDVIQEPSDKVVHNLVSNGSSNICEETQKGRSVARRSAAVISRIQDSSSDSDDVVLDPKPDLNSDDQEKVIEVLEDLLTKEEFHESEYAEVLDQISESTKPSEDVIKRLLELSIIVNWSVHPTHQVESRVTRPPTEEEMAQMKCLNEDMRKGRFLLHEDNTIKKNWEKFSQEYGFENPKDFQCIRINNRYLLPPEEFKKFARYLGRGLPQRTLHSVLFRFRKLFQECVHGRLPGKIKEVFQKHVERYGKKYTGIKNILNKSIQDLSGSAAYFVSPLKGKSFKSLEAKTELFKAILKVTDSKSYEDLKGKTIEWKKVSEILNVRSESCRKYWTRYLSGFMALEKPIAKRAVKDKLIECLKKLNVGCSLEVDWNKISPEVFGLPASFLWHAFSQECDSLKITYTGDQWKGAMEKLSASQEVNRPRRRQDTMYECCKFVNSKIVNVKCK